MTNVSLFKFKDHNVRVVIIAGEPWWVAADVCNALGMDLYAGTSQWLIGLAPDQKRRASRKELPELFSGTRSPSLNLVSESGLYKLVLRSDKPEAKPFQDWVTRDVLPAIRKDGSYVMGEEKVLTGEMSEDELMARAFVAATRKLERLGAGNEKRPRCRLP